MSERITDERLQEYAAWDVWDDDYQRDLTYAARELLARRAAERQHPTWYLLYGGESEDGMGPGKYIGRTADIEVARKHLHECRKNPYSTGSVRIVTDTEVKMAIDDDLPPSPAKGLSHD